MDGGFIADGVVVFGRDNFIADDDDDEDEDVGGGRNNGYGERFISKGKPNGEGNGGRIKLRSL